MTSRSSASLSPTLIRVVGAAILDEQERCLITQRSAHMSNPLKWEFPGGKIEPGESPQQALARELREELGLHAQIGAWVGQGHADLDDQRRVVLDVYVARPLQALATLTLREHAQARWITLSQLPDLDWALADWPIVRAILARLSWT